MQIFKITKNLDVVCESKDTRYGFKHTATLVRNGYEHGDSEKCCYYNRTWERYTFESVLEKLARKSKDLSDSERKTFEKKIKNGFQKEDRSLKTVGMIAALGEVFGQTQKEKNDWKARMLKAGLTDKGLIMPDDWNELDEDTKEARLNAAIKQIQ